MELLIVFNILLLLFLVGTYLSLSGRVRKLEEVLRRKAGGADVAPGGREAASAAAPPATGAALAGEPISHQTSGRDSHMLRPRTREEWEILFGGKLLNRVGALALILAVGFFLKYAFDNDWLNETARVILGGAVGLLLIAGGYRFHGRQLAVFSQGLTGAGVAILYLSIYAAFDFYHLLPQPVAFFLMALVTAAAFLLSLHYDARAIALLGWAGGFLTPLLLVTTELNTLGLFIYLTLLDAGLIAILIRRRGWRLLELLAIAATYGIYLTWSFRADLPDGLGIALAFLTLWWALFVGVNLFRAVTGDHGNRWWQRAAISINVMGLYLMLMRLTGYSEGLWDFFGVQFQYEQNAQVYAAGVVAAILSLAYFGLTAWIVRRTEDRSAAATHESAAHTAAAHESAAHTAAAHGSAAQGSAAHTSAAHESAAHTAATYATVAVLLAVIVPTRFFTSYGVIISWALEAFALFWFGVHFGRRAVRHAGTVLGALSFVAIFLHGGTIVSSLVSAYVPILSLRTGAYWVVGGLLLAFAAMMQDRDEKRSDRVLFSIFHVAWSFLLLVWGTVEVLSYFQYRMIMLGDGSLNQLENMRQLAVSGVWLIGAALVMIIGRLLEIRALRVAAIVYFGCTVVKAFVFDLMMLDTLYRIFAFLGLSAILIAVSYFYYKKRPVS